MGIFRCETRINVNLSQIWYRCGLDGTNGVLNDIFSIMSFRLMPDSQKSFIFFLKKLVIKGIKA